MAEDENRNPEERTLKPIRTILHPTDFSECAEYARALARSLARDVGARLVLLHVVPGVEHVPGAENPEVYDEAARALRQLKVYQDEMLAELKRRPAPSSKVSVEILLIEGGVATEIVGAAEETASDLIVMGTHGRTGEAKWLMGSVAEAVTRKARCAVVTVRAPMIPEPLA
jgi:nucleotide-binding universal stress UspA family protein